MNQRVMKVVLPIVLVIAAQVSTAQSKATVKESLQPFKTYPFGDPNPIPGKTHIYPYFRFDGFTNKPENKQWKVIELENQFIKLIVLPEVGGKVWAAWEKSTGRPFLYNNHVVKFRDVAMRGPWTSGGIEANYGIIGHTPNCATPVDYKIETKPDGSASCYIGVFDKLTQTYWTIDINLPSDKAYFTTRSTWHNGTNLEQPYYTWMNVGMPAKGNLEFIYPGTRYLGHEGEFADWKLNLEKNKDISFYEKNNFGGYKSYHVFGSYTDFFGAFYHDLNFGMGRYSLYDEKPGKKIWIWGLSRQGMIWENLLTDSDGQYVEIQSGRLFNQSSEGSMLTPFKNRGFAAYSTDEWTEYWFPVVGTNGMVKENPFGALNIITEKGYLKWSFSPLQKFEDELIISDGSTLLKESNVSLNVLKLYRDSIQWNGDIKNVTFRLGSKFLFDGNTANESLSRPVKLPSDFKWDSPYGLYSLGKEAAQGRDYEKAFQLFSECLTKDPYYLPALSELSFLHLRKLQYEDARKIAIKALSIDTYDPASNFAYGLASVATNHIPDAKDGFGISSASIEFRAAAFTELSKLYLRSNLLDQSLAYANKALTSSPSNLTAQQLKALCFRLLGEVDRAKVVHKAILEINPLSHFVEAENFITGSIGELGSTIQQEMRNEVFLDLADWYHEVNQFKDAIKILKQAPPQSENLLWQAYLMNKVGDVSFRSILEQATLLSPNLIFPYRSTAAAVMEWATQQSTSWIPKYFLGILQWNRGNTETAIDLFTKCGSPSYAPFYAARASMTKSNTEQDLKEAARLDNSNWRYGKLLASHYLDIKETAKALSVIQDFNKRFPDNDAVYSLTIKCLLRNALYEQAYKMLSSKVFLPNEGATENRQLYRESLLMMAFSDIEKKRYSSALDKVKLAKQWPENLGVGKPYDEDIDDRLELLTEAICLSKMKRKAESEKIFQKLVVDKVSMVNINQLATAFAMRELGQKEDGLSLLEKWRATATDKSLAEWSIELFNHGKAPETSLSNDNTRLYTKLFKILE